MRLQRCARVVVALCFVIAGCWAELHGPGEPSPGMGALHQPL